MTRIRHKGAQQYSHALQKGARHAENLYIFHVRLSCRKSAFCEVLFRLLLRKGRDSRHPRQKPRDLQRLHLRWVLVRRAHADMRSAEGLPAGVPVHQVQRKGTGTCPGHGRSGARASVPDMAQVQRRQGDRGFIRRAARACP